MVVEEQYMNRYDEMYLWDCIINGNVRNLSILLFTKNIDNCIMKYIPSVPIIITLSLLKNDMETIKRFIHIFKKYNMMTNYNSNVKYVEICYNYNIYNMTCNVSHFQFFDYNTNIFNNNVIDINNMTPEKFIDNLLIKLNNWYKSKSMFKLIIDNNLYNNIIYLKLVFTDSNNDNYVDIV